jgi:DNA-binding transcriptional LysR family regulator
MKESAIAKLRFGQLRLLALMEGCGSLRRVATEVHMTQPAVSKSLKELESILDVKLFERHSKGVIATPAGRVAAQGAQLLLAELGVLAKEIAQAEADDSISVSIGITSYLGSSVLPEVLARLSGKLQMGHVYLEEGWAGPLIDRLCEGSLDMLLIMCTTDMAPALHNRSLKFEHLFDEELAVVAAPDHPLARRQRVQLAELAEERWILGVQPSLTRRSLEEAFMRQGIAPPRPAIEATFLPNLFELAASGLGIAACPLRGVENALASGRVARIALRPTIQLAPILLVYRRLLSEHPRLATLAESLRREFTT